MKRKKNYVKLCEKFPQVTAPQFLQDLERLENVLFKKHGRMKYKTLNHVIWGVMEHNTFSELSGTLPLLAKLASIPSVQFNRE